MATTRTRPHYQDVLKSVAAFAAQPPDPDMAPAWSPAARAWGQLIDSDDAAEALFQLVDELISVGRAEGRLRDFLTRDDLERHKATIGPIGEAVEAFIDHRYGWDAMSRRVAFEVGYETARCHLSAAEKVK